MILIRLCREPKKGLANNHKTCAVNSWTRHGTDDFLGSEWTMGGAFQALRLKHNCLDPDG